SSAFLLVTWWMSWSTKALYAISSRVRLMFAVCVGLGDDELGPPEHAATITAKARRATSPRRIDLRIGAATRRECSPLSVRARRATPRATRRGPRGRCG